MSDRDFIKNNPINPINYYESKRIKRKIAKQLPNDVKLVIYSSQAKTNHIYKAFRNAISRQRINILKVANQGESQYWARDALPVAAYDKNGKVIFIDAKYYKKFEQDKVFAKYLNVSLYSHNYEFEGGNLLADRNANCFTIASKYIPDNPEDIFFNKYYGCNKTIILKHVRGIGHIDEVIKIIDDKNIITDVDEYKSTLEGLGYNVTMIPQAQGKYENYLNSLIINNKVFVPTYKRPTDKQAIRVYNNFFSQVFPINAKELATHHTGAIHCLTMTYPPVNQEKT